MINRFFGALLLASAALMTGCLKEEDNGSIDAVLPGMQIYDLTMRQNGASYQPANAAVRLAILLAEAGKQQAAAEEGAEPVALDKLTVKDINVQETLFGQGTRVEALEGGDYRITYPKDKKLFGFYFEGSLTVRTGGVQLAATDRASGWSVDADNFKVISESGEYMRRSIDYHGGSTELFNNGATFSVRATAMDLSFVDSEVHSSWTGHYNFMPEGTMSLAYSDCGGKPFNVSGSSEGETIYAFVGDATPMRYTLDDGAKYYIGGQLISGRVTAEFTAAGSYDTATYPSPKVVYDYTYNPQNNTYSVEIEYDNVKYVI